MIDMITVSDIERVREALKSIFPDAARGSVARPRWGHGRKELHLCYWVAPDTVGGLKAVGRGQLLYFIEWDTNAGQVCHFAESDVDEFIKRIKRMYSGKVYSITRMVGNER